MGISKRLCKDQAAIPGKMQISSLLGHHSPVGKWGLRRLSSSPGSAVDIDVTVGNSTRFLSEPRFLMYVNVVFRIGSSSPI